MAHAHLGVVGELDLEPSRDLVGRPEPLEPAGDLAQQPAPAELVGLRSPGFVSGALVGVPGGVVLATAIVLDLAGDRRRHPAELAGDRAERLTPADTEENPLALGDREIAAPGLPPERLRIGVATGAHHDADHRPGAADLLRDVDETPALRPEAERELLLFRAEMAMSSLHRCPPVIGFRSSHRTRCAHRLISLALRVTSVLVSPPILSVAWAMRRLVGCFNGYQE